MPVNGIEFLKNIINNYCHQPIDALVMDKEGSEYAACTFKINNQQILYRMAKITPTKIGQFVTVWKRNKEQITAPYSLNDKLDYYIIATKKDALIGYFIFPIAILYKKGIIADGNEKGGKRGFRVYPAWDITNNKQAQNSQEWQNEYFLDCSKTLDTTKLINMLP